MDIFNSVLNTFKSILSGDSDECIDISQIPSPADESSGVDVRLGCVMNDMGRGDSDQECG